MMGTFPRPLRGLLLGAAACGLVAVPPASAVGERPAQPPAGPTERSETGRRVEVRGEWLYVDGEAFLVKGVGYSPYRPGQVPWRDRVDPAVMARDFQRITEAGFNTIRTWSPLGPEALALADRYGLMVLQGIWVERTGDYTSQAFRQAMLETVRKEVERAAAHQNILAFLVGNELLPERVYEVGVLETESLLKQASSAVKKQDPGRLVSYANWPSLSFLDPTMWDAISFNLYPYQPSSISHSFGFRGYVEYLKRTLARGRPLLITEVGLSVSPVAGSTPGYGGLSRDARRTELLRLWDDLFQGGAQGGVIFEWNDEWWKQADAAADEATHEPNDPEEWFGLIEFTAPDDIEGLARPDYEALKTYNQAILLSPVSGERYRQRIPVTVYAADGMREIRVRLDAGKWYAATKLNRHWWKAQVPLGADEAAGAHRLTMEALAGTRRVVVRRERAVVVGEARPPAALAVTTDRTLYEAGGSLEPVRYTITVTDGAGRPLAEQPVYWAVAEPQVHADLMQTGVTDGSGRIEGTYLVQEPGFILLSAATPTDRDAPERRVGAETVVIVRPAATPSHHPSRWEAGLPPAITDALRHESPAFQLADPGREQVVDYDRYGTFLDVGTPTYRYEVDDWEGLAAAVGEGVYPNEGGLMKDPAYRAARQAGTLEGSHWDFTWLDDPQLSFFKWASTEEEVGVKQFYTALTLERSGLWLQAVKAYDAVLVHFPRSIGWTAFDPPTPWYVGKVARDRIEAILRLHPELGMRLEGASVVVNNGFDNEVDNDTFLPSPGRLVRVEPDEVNPPSVERSALAVAREAGRGRVRLARYANGHWAMTVDGRPWVVRGLTYRPTAVGETHDEQTVLDWTQADRNANGRLDVLETFVDDNRNNRQDPEEPTIGDFEMLRRLGVNTLRLYHTDNDVQKTKAILRDLHERYGFMVMMGDFVGMYTVGSGATWEEGTNYLDKAQRKRMLENVKKMVRAYKDEPYLLLWVLGNENNFGGVHGIVGGFGNAGRYPKEYYSFINELASWIHATDPDHPVAIGNGETLFLDLIARHAPAIDIFGANAYRGWHGFGRSFFEEVRQWLDKPVLILEYGCPAYQMGQGREVAERDQALYHLGNWVDLADNLAGRGVGNALGAAVFEWSDEWWKAGQPPRFAPDVQETTPNWAGPYPGGWNFEEWFGLVSQGDGGLSPYVRQPRLSYALYQALWRLREGGE